MRLRNFSRSRCPHPRRGAVTLWFILSLPVLLTLLCVMLEVGNLYLARAELKNALEAGAQAAVKNWAENYSMTGGDTLHARMAGNTYAMANTLSGVPVDLSAIDSNAFPLNYDPAEPCNQNACRDGVFVFGAIRSSDPKFRFDCCTLPRPCGVGTVLFDASGQGSLDGGNNHEWGIRFLDEPEVPPSLLITRIRITLSGTTRFQPATFGLADAAGPFKVVDQSAATPEAPDLFGLASDQITPAFLGGNTILEFTFSSRGLDSGFEKGDRFRFGMVVNAGQGNRQIDGDEIGQPGTQARVLVEFSDGTTASGAFIDTRLGGQFGPPPPRAKCANTGVYDPAHQSLAVFPLPVPIPDLPCPPASAAGNDGQSFVQLQGSGGGFQNAFAVRAQASYPVKSICRMLFGVPIGPFTVTAKADALYECASQSPRLYHLERPNATCNANCP